jgi:hypothetical protein
MNSLDARWLVPAKRVQGYALTTKAREMTRGCRGLHELERQLMRDSSSNVKHCPTGKGIETANRLPLATTQMEFKWGGVCRKTKASFKYNHERSTSQRQEETVAGEV